ncbi:MAG: hypothetical protein EA425_13700 [Puniceicoccaceae bacterium]|nr:MAG: hypothetical protein EA425_13700 [Puniceicoccaceae bacterium]
MHQAATGKPTDPPAAADHWLTFLAHFLIILSAWTIVIKYLFPITFAAFEGVALTRYVFWDLWPVAHLWLAWALLRMPWYTRPLAIAMAAIEIVIILTLFTLFLNDPEWSIWRTNWFINKLFVLLCFILILFTATLGRRRFPPASAARPSSHP